ncbi:LptF/LptG family permease [Symmachiella dynata]|uniref:LptF/LptG family permease n=1 Tax=Symmachiella dynata TaxID=2527995 RepID=UPI00118B6F2C|nr:LptF/LptG family permease [Symmachiella dynata]QDT47699.1 putative permease YjgP/YjgQ family protein [Symmachiella dynata]|tara:strand:+ start:66 stop:1193 length:1128 start_codon:yes stop_codon:yes gene_type:complete
MSTFDRYILRRFWHVFVVSFIAMMGLYIVIDAFNNIDNFFNEGDSGTLGVMGTMARFYLFRSSMFFDTIGGIVSVTAVTVVLSLILRHGELNPVLSAGIPTYRLLFPLLWGMVMVSAIMVINKELIIPRIADELQIEAGKSGDEDEPVEPVWDFATMVQISGDRLYPARNAMTRPDFVLPTPEFVDNPTALSGSEAIFVPADENHSRSGWLIKEAEPSFDELKLTLKKAGRATITRGSAADEIFIATEIDFDRLYRPDKTVDFISTPELIRRIKSPAYDVLSVRENSLYLHQRFTQPILNILLLFLILPLIVRREARGLVVSMCLSGLMQGVVFGTAQACLWLAGIEVIGPDLAAWGPVIVTGGLATWCWPMLRT